MSRREKNRWGRFDMTPAEVVAAYRQFRHEDALREHKARLLIRILRWIALWFSFGGQVIPGQDPGSPYLLRAYLTPNLWKLPSPYLHNFFRSDEDPHGHNHPWLVSISIILARGYVEWRFNRRKNTWKRIVRKPWRPWAPWRIVVVWRNTYHKVELRNGPAWTIFITFWRLGNEDDWGFWVPNSGHTPWKQYLEQRKRETYAAD